MIVILILLLMALLAFVFYYFHKEICCAPFLFIAPFIVMCCVAWLFSDTWNFHMHLNTFLVILMGNVFFVLGAVFAQKIRFVKLGYNHQIVQDRNESVVKYFFLLLLQCVCYLWKVKLIMQFAGSKNLAIALAYFDRITKFTTESTIRWPRILSIGLDICTAVGYVCACVLAQKLIQKKNEKKYLILVALNFCVAVLGGLSSGGRGLAVRYLIAFIISLLIMFFREKEWKFELEFRFIFRILCILFLTAAFFIVSREMVGRGAVSRVGEYLAKYIGAQVYNLDYYLNKAFRRSEIFGQETFQPLIKFVCSRLEIQRWSNYLLDLPFRRVGKIDMGNVHTTFYPYIHDFGYWGVLFVPLFFGFLSQSIYKSARLSPIKHTIHLGLVVYSDVAYSIIFSFFSNKFGEGIITVAMVKKVFFMWLIICFLFYARFNGRSLILDVKAAFGIQLKSRKRRIGEKA